MKTKRIKNISQLKKLASNENGIEVSLILGGGLFKSSKHILYNKNNKKFTITNYIDNSEIVLSEKEINNKKKTNIGIGMKRNCLIYYY